MILYTVDHKCCTGTITFAFVVPDGYNILNVIKVLITLLTLNINC